MRNKFRYKGSERWCAVCESSSSLFLPVGFNPLEAPRKDARCPMCGSVERHRLLVTFLKDRTDLFDGKPKDFLHIAPEKCFVRMFSRAAGKGYLTADLMAEDVMEKMDITDIKKPDNSFDVIYCSHVLEHVDDDRKAMREFFRVLKPKGWAVLNVPVTADTTFEDPTVTDPVERNRLFGQYDHVRKYGPDYEDRLVEAGFTVARVTSKELMKPEEIVRHGLSNVITGDVFYCTK